MPNASRRMQCSVHYRESEKHPMRTQKHPDAEPTPYTLDHIRRALDSDVHGVRLAEGEQWPESPGVGIDWREACAWLVGQAEDYRDAARAEAEHADATEAELTHLRLHLIKVNREARDIDAMHRHDKEIWERGFTRADADEARLREQRELLSSVAEAAATFVIARADQDMAAFAAASDALREAVERYREGAREGCNQTGGEGVNEN